MQLELFGKPRTTHGGNLRKGKRKEYRPIDTRTYLHVTMRSTRARGTYSLLTPKNRHHVKEILKKSAQRHKVEIYRFVNVGNHLHLILKARERKAIQNFLRQATGHIAQVITGALKGKSKGKFWDHLAYSRIVRWGRDFVGLHKYFLKNLAEALGVKVGKQGIDTLVIPRTGPPLEEVWGEILEEDPRRVSRGI